MKISENKNPTMLFMCVMYQCIEVVTPTVFQGFLFVTAGRWPCLLLPTYKTDHHGITDILLKVVLNTNKQKKLFVFDGANTLLGTLSFKIISILQSLRKHLLF